jgi:hypothetical protein
LDGATTSQLRHAVNVGRSRVGRAILQSAGSCIWLFVCECGSASCEAEVEVSLDEFDSLRTGEGWLLAPGHRLAPVEASQEETARLTHEAAALTAHAGEVGAYEWRNLRFRP